MSILSGWLKTRAYRKTTDGYKKESRDTSSETVFMNDGNTAETNLGDIKGITDSLTATSSNVALSAKGGNSLQGQIDTLNSNLNRKSNLLYNTSTKIEVDTSITIPNANEYSHFAINYICDGSAFTVIVPLNKEFTLCSPLRFPDNIAVNAVIFIFKNGVITCTRIACVDKNGTFYENSYYTISSIIGLNL